MCVLYFSAEGLVFRDVDSPGYYKSKSLKGYLMPVAKDGVLKKGTEVKFLAWLGYTSSYVACLAFFCNI